MQSGEVLVIDLFAGPGGLGEGISSCEDENGNKPFQIGVSVEKEVSAHKTLTTRAFYRKIKELPSGSSDYYQYVRGSITRDELFSIYPEQAQEALLETLEQPRELGKDNKLIHKKIRSLVSAHHGPKIVIGGPPCQAYSLAGRSRNAGIENYKPEDDHRNFLYLEYLKILSIAQPDIFVMENVRGILSAKVNGKIMFPQILDDLSQPGRVTKTKRVPRYRIYSLVKSAADPKNPSYENTADFLIKAEEYGIPQARHRVILLGVREDIEALPKTISPIKKMVTVEQVIADLPYLRSGFSKQEDVQSRWEEDVLKNSKKIKSVLAKKFDQEKVDKLNLSPRAKLNRLDKKVGRYKPKLPKHLESWYLDKNLKCVLNHMTRGHMASDLMRYAYSAAYTKLSNGVSPKSRDFPKELAPAHENWNTGAHADRFRTQAANKCATTVTSHISKDGHYFIHYDPRQCRSLTVREAARLQTFPDNYLFEGNRTQQYVQVGNAVPPYLARKIGEIVLDLLCN